MLSLPLAKLSVARDEDPSEQRFEWKHESQHLTFVLDSYGSYAGLQQLKVVQGTQVRQVIELEHLIRDGNAMVKAAEKDRRQLKTDQLPISAIVRCPLLAIRWQLPSMKVRRVQLKFVSDEDYEVAYNQLNRMGLRMTSSRDSQGTSNSRTLSPVRPASAQTSTKLSCPPSRLAEIRGRPHTATNAPTVIESKVQESAYENPASAFSSSGTSVPPSPGPLSGPLAPPVYFPRPTSATSSVLGRFYDISSEPRQEENSSTKGKSFLQNSNSTCAERPSTAENILPPRRELPFQRSSLSSSPKSDMDRPPSRPSTGPMGPPPLPSRVASLRPTSSRGNDQETDLPPLPKPTVITGSATMRPLTPSASRSFHSNDSHTILDDSIKGNSFAHCSPIHSTVSSDKSTSSTLLKSRPSSSTCADDVPDTSTLRTGQSVSGAIGHGSVKAGCASSPNMNEMDKLAEYLKQPGEVRRAALNEYIYRQLQSDDFLALVEDMETCWARIVASNYRNQSEGKKH